MNAKKYSTFLMLALLVAIAACAPSDPDPITVEVDDLATNGDPVVAIGNSLTAGLMNGGVVIDGQTAGFANLVARQITGTAPYGMSMPLIAAPGIGSESGFSLLKVTAQGALTRDPLTVDPTELLLASALLQPYANLGVPGALTVDVVRRTGALPPADLDFLPPNPFFDIVLRNSALPFGDATQLDQLEQIVASPLSNPLLLMLWIGNNDILGGATGGDPQLGVNVFPATTGNPASPGYRELMIGAGTYADPSPTSIVGRVKATGIPFVALANIPSITSAPYFTAVGGAIAAAGASIGDINTDEADVQMILLPAQTLLFTPTGEVNTDYIAGVGTESLPSTLTLTSAEVSLLAGVVSDYNGEIAEIAGANGWALVDVNAELASLPVDPADPATFGQLNGLFPLLPGLGPMGGLGQNAFSAFSLDGIHPSEKGYARTANLFIDALNATYGAQFSVALGGPIPNVDEGPIENRLGFEEFNAGGQATFRNMPMTDSASEALRNLPFSR